MNQNKSCLKSHSHFCVIIVIDVVCSINISLLSPSFQDSSRKSAAMTHHIDNHDDRKRTFIGKFVHVSVGIMSLSYFF